MHFSNLPTDGSQLGQGGFDRHLTQLKKQMNKVRQELEFIEILAQFWPFPNMADKMERLNARMKKLEADYRHYQTRQSVFSSTAMDRAVQPGQAASYQLSTSR